MGRPVYACAEKQWESLRLHSGSEIITTGLKTVRSEHFQHVEYILVYVNCFFFNTLRTVIFVYSVYADLCDIMSVLSCSG